MPQPYRGDFPDPTVLRVGRVYYAYSTTIAGLNLPVMTSRDLVHWRARGEGLARVASWARGGRTGSGTHATTWAPTVARFAQDVRARLRHTGARRPAAQDVHLHVEVLLAPAVASSTAGVRR